MAFRGMVGWIYVAVRSCVDHWRGLGLECADAGIEHGFLHSFGSIHLIILATEKNA